MKKDFSWYKDLKRFRFAKNGNFRYIIFIPTFSVGMTSKVEGLDRTIYFTISFLSFTVYFMYQKCSQVNKKPS
jgi:hypothetical protein